MSNWSLPSHIQNLVKIDSELCWTMHYHNQFSPNFACSLEMLWYDTLIFCYFQCCWIDVMRLWVDWSIVDAVGVCVQVDDGDGVCHECCLLFSAAGMFQVVLQCRATVPLRHWTHVLTIMLHWHQCSRLTGTLVCCCWLSTNDAARDCSGSVSAVCCEFCSAFLQQLAA